MTEQREFNVWEKQLDKFGTLITNPIIASFFILSFMGSAAYFNKAEVIDLVKQLMNIVGSCK